LPSEAPPPDLALSRLPNTTQQEAGNVPYVVDGGFGVYTGNHPRKIAKTVVRFFSDDKLLDRMSREAIQRSRPAATAAIARDIGNIVLRQDLQLPKLPPSETADI
jgi:1,2-diacylglycerol 3-beta-galactosyltransferase